MHGDPLLRGNPVALHRDAAGLDSFVPGIEGLSAPIFTLVEMRQR